MQTKTSRAASMMGMGFAMAVLDGDGDDGWEDTLGLPRGWLNFG